MTAIFTGAGILALLAIVYSMWLFDCLIRWEYEHHRDKWEHDGKPDGFFWKAEECKFWSSDIAKKRLAVLWLVSAPEWVEDNPKCRRWLLQIRIISLSTIFIVLLVLLRLAVKVLH